MPGDLLDLLLIVLAAAFALAGYRQGFIIGILSFAGFIGGVAVGAVFAPRISTALAASASWQAFIAIVVVFAAAVIGMMLASGLGVAVRARVRGRPATFIDSMGGALMNVIAVLLVAWLIGSFVAYAPFPSISRQVNGSLVLRTVDRLMPRAALSLPGFPALHGLLTSGPYTQVFGALGAESALAVGPADPAVLNARGFAIAKASVVKIVGTAPSCALNIDGSGFVIAPDRVLTNAHVVAGVTQGSKVITLQGAEYPARVVLYDSDRDIAVLAVPGLTAPPLQLAGPASSGANAIVAGYPLDGPFMAGPARVGRAELASGPNIYQTAQVNRQIYPVRALVRPGNSGGPLLAPDGRVYGVVFAAATSVPDTGYALTASEIAPDLALGERDSATVSTEGCTGR